MQLTFEATGSASRLGYLSHNEIRSLHFELGQLRLPKNYLYRVECRRYDYFSESGIENAGVAYGEFAVDQGLPRGTTVVLLLGQGAVTALRA